MSGTRRSKSDKSKWIYLIRQLLVNSGVWSTFFILGLNSGAPTVLVPQLRAEANSTEAVSAGEASWLPVIVTYSGIPWVFILPMIATFYGRKITHIIVCSFSIIGFIVFYFSSNVHQIMISQFFQGPVMASYMTIAIIVITEYTSSEYRGVFLTIKSATVFWGVLVANAIGTFFHWTNIPLLGLLCAIYNLLTVYFWPESPLWLVKKGRFDQCAESHRWLKGSDRHKEKELETLIANNKISENKLSLKCQAIAMLKAMVKKQFYKPVLLSNLLIWLYMCSGKAVCTIYAVEVLKKITNNTSAAYTGMLILDAVTVFTMYIGCGFSKIFKRRTLLLTSSTIGILFMFLLSLYLYLVKLSVTSENKYLSIALLAGYSIAIGCGPMILLTSIIGELIPLDFRSWSLCVIALSNKIMFGIFVKVSPSLFGYFGMHGTFLLFGITSSIFLVLIYRYLPETKDKTLQEIADLILDVKSVEETEELLVTEKNNVRIMPK